MTVHRAHAQLADAPTTLIDARTVPFHDELARHGQWLVTQRFGIAWQPFEAVRSDFRPYFSRGRWMATQHGWAFDSPVPWSRIAYHYGRWVYAEEAAGWIWLPGTTWAASWVDWRWNDDIVGWAPRAPEGLSFAYDAHAHFVFVDVRGFSAPNFSAFVVPAARIDPRSLERERSRVPHGPPVRVTRPARIVRVSAGLPRPRVHVAPALPRPTRPAREGPYARTRRIALAPPGASLRPPPEPPPAVARAVPVARARRRAQR